MRISPREGPSSLVKDIEDRVRRDTHGRIRDLAVEEMGEGRVEIRGQVPSHHTRQLALHAVLQLLPGDRCHPCITVG